MEPAPLQVLTSVDDTTTPSPVCEGECIVVSVPEEKVLTSSETLEETSVTDSDEQEVNSVIEDMIASGYTLTWCIHIGKGMFKFTRAKEDVASKSTITKKEQALGLDCSNVQLFRSIKKWRLDLCRSKNVSAFSILFDSVAVDVVKSLPQDIAQLKSIKGIGEKKALEYGESLLELVKVYKDTCVDTSNLMCWFDPISKLHYDC